jgi:hypothetical protein
MRVNKLEASVQSQGLELKGEDTQSETYVASWKDGTREDTLALLNLLLLPGSVGA